ncbi:MAG: hypothetical protein J5851_05690, partial [Oscillospiraceae bacterium]|nr:hypothetical protein [Oscillospiraceae bacterium]
MKTVNRAAAFVTGLLIAATSGTILPVTAEETQASPGLHSCLQSLPAQMQAMATDPIITTMSDGISATT